LISSSETMKLELADARRTYNQFCGLSRSLDIVGERWTLLIVREFMSGPKRTPTWRMCSACRHDLLATRIRQLEHEGIIRSPNASAPAASQVYELTPVGHELAQALFPWRYGECAINSADTHAGETYRAEWTLSSSPNSSTQARQPAGTATYQFRIDDSAAQLHGPRSEGDGRARRGRQTAQTPRSRTDFATIVELVVGGLAPPQLSQAHASRSMATLRHSSCFSRCSSQSFQPEARSPTIRPTTLTPRGPVLTRVRKAAARTGEVSRTAGWRAWRRAVSTRVSVESALQRERASRSLSCWRPRRTARAGEGRSPSVAAAWARCGPWPARRSGVEAQHGEAVVAPVGPGRAGGGSPGSAGLVVAGEPGGRVA